MSIDIQLHNLNRLTRHLILSILSNLLMIEPLWGVTPEKVLALRTIPLSQNSQKPDFTLPQYTIEFTPHASIDTYVYIMH